MSDIVARTLLDTGTIAISDVDCHGGHAGLSDEECTSATQLVFPYRGVFVRHVGRDDAVGEANQALFFNANEAYRVSHPVAGGDACLSIAIADRVLDELAPRDLLRAGSTPVFRRQRLRIDARAQALVALLRHGLRHHVAEPLEAESLTLTLARRTFGLGSAPRSIAGARQQRLADRVKLVLSSDLARRWTLGQIAAKVGHSPVYLTQVFQQVESLPLYRYHLRLRLARALEMLPHYDDLTSLGLDLGFSSHSHFSTAFAKAYGCAPSTFKQAASRR